MNERSEVTVTITDEQWELCYDKMMEANNGNVLTNEDIIDAAKELAESEKYGRSENSAWFSINRLHVLVFGVAAHGITEQRAETLFAECETAKRFVELLGYTTEEIDRNLAQARKEMAKRAAEMRRLAQLKKDAHKINFQYWKENRDQYNKRTQDALRAHRDDIIDAIGNGVPVEEAYAQYV